MDNTDHDKLTNSTRSIYESTALNSFEWRRARYVRYGSTEIKLGTFIRISNDDLIQYTKYNYR